MVTLDVQCDDTESYLSNVVLSCIQNYLTQCSRKLANASETWSVIFFVNQ